MTFWYSSLLHDSSLNISSNAALTRKLAAARADGSASVLSLNEDSTALSVVSEWKESRLKEDQRYVGLASSSTCVYPTPPLSMPNEIKLACLVESLHALLMVPSV